MLEENGINMLDTMNTGRLAAEGVREFMFVLGQVRSIRASQIAINSVVMW